MEPIRRILEIQEKGADSATIDDVPLILQLLCRFINMNPSAQDIIKNYDLFMVLDFVNSEKFHLIISSKECRYGKGGIPNPNFLIRTDILTLSRVLLGDLDLIEAFFSEAIRVNGDLTYVLLYLELMDLAFEKLKIQVGKERKISTRDMKKLLEVYEKGASEVKVEYIPLFFELLTVFINFNPEAQDYIKDENKFIQITILDVGNFLLKIKDNKMSWSMERDENAEVRLEMTLKTSIEVLIHDDAVSQFMSGNIKVLGNITDAIFFQDLISMFLEKIDVV